MKKKFLILLMVSALFLVACDEKQEETETKELVFLEKTNDYVSPSFIFESPKDEKYYLVEVSNWQYDNATFKKDDVVQLESKKSEDGFFLSEILTYSVIPDGITLPSEDVFIYDDWTGLYILTEYTKEN